jgi:undecaprenyl diphosphate synthase
VAIIMDGNGRWAHRRGLPRPERHQVGTANVRPISQRASELGGKYLTLYAFSTENWKRPRGEVDAIMNLLVSFYRSEIDDMIRKNVRIRIVGDVAGMPLLQRETLQAAMRRTAANTGLQLNLALNYGGRAELTRAAQLLARRAVKEGVAPDSFTEADFQSALYTSELPDVDLLIRTGGEMRVSNFLPWQTAYAEFVVTDTLWPDFHEQALDDAIAEFRRRDRRFGMVKA